MKILILCTGNSCRSQMARRFLHMGFKDPSLLIGSEDLIIGEFRKIREEIRASFYKFYNDFLI